jgi:hypothetical protein
MRSAAILVSALAALTLAAPRPQDIEWDQVDSAPDADPVTPPVDVASDTVVIQPVSDAKSLGSDAVTDVASTKREIQQVKKDFLKEKSWLGKRDGTCAAEPAGTGPQVSRLVFAVGTKVLANIDKS